MATKTASKKPAIKVTIIAKGKATPTATQAPAKPKGYSNPFRVGSNYHAIVATLEGMGANKPHPYADFEKRIQKDWDGWKEFATRKARKGVEVHHDPLGKLKVNVTVLQRADYGAPLHKQNACIDLTRDDEGAILIMLNTKSSEPKTPGRAPSAKKETVKKSAEKKATPKPTTKSADKRPPILEGREALRALSAKGNGVKRNKAA